MYCAHCGSAISGEDLFCRKCRAAHEDRSPVRAAGSNLPTQSSQDWRSAPADGSVATASVHLAIPLAMIGFFVGGLIGFMMRPSAFLVGQLPFETVITGGANLTGLDQLLRSTAQNSLNLMIMGAVLGALTGAIVGVLIKLQPARRG